MAVKAHPFVKWVGGKTQLIPYLREILPSKIQTYYEPFIGGGAVFYALGDEGRFKRAVLNDWNADLVNTYRVVRDFPEELMAFLTSLETMYKESPKAIYAMWRNPESSDLTPLEPVQLAGRFIFLNKAGFNGLYRVNLKGKFNVPWGQKLEVRTHDPENIRACSALLDRVASIRQGDFLDACSDAQPGDCVYFDPPYVPLNATSDFTSYTANRFGMVDQQRLAELFTQLAERGVTVLLSNSDTPVVRALYAGWELHEVKMKRNVNSNGAGRGAVGELIVVGRRDTRTEQDPADIKRLLTGTNKKVDDPEPSVIEREIEEALDQEPDPAQMRLSAT